MLDVARETYKENTHDIMQCESSQTTKLTAGADRLKGELRRIYSIGTDKSERYKLELNLEWDIRGCHLSLPRDEQLSLDSSFIRVEKSKSK